MALPPRGKKPPPKPPEDDFGLLLEEEAGDTGALEEEGDEFGDDYADDLGGLEGEDPLAAESDLGIDPEAAGLMERLGFSEPDQQQAFVDLVKLLMGPPPMAAEDPMAGPEMDMGF